MKSFNEFLNKPVTFQDIPDGVLYHGTHPAFLDKIKKDGLLVGLPRNEWSSSTNVVYLTSDIKIAWEYSYTVIYNRAKRANIKLTNPITLALIKIKVKDLPNISKLKFDTNRAKRGNEKAKSSNTHFEYVGNLPPNILDIITKGINL